jgi:hypothetical protein
MRFGISDRSNFLARVESTPMDLIETFTKIPKVIETPMLKKVKNKFKKRIAKQ